MKEVEITVSVNGGSHTETVEPRLSLAEFLRRTLGQTGTHVGCEHGVCGACTVVVDGRSIRSCLMFAIQTDGSEVTTVEGLAQSDAELGPLQAAFRRCHGLQCGFCTPGMLMTLTDFLSRNPDPTREEIRIALTANACRCTGYKGIVDAAMEAAAEMRGKSDGR
ncbi:(2Fe-2S)-binding protein [uncultured Sneathiella sp.]|uniref:(2Fe-2S)-binding protein n=1 Tax=uncultured Sneathiella sp. TaxID=879315 RepID=UPI0025946690|nr:(2Fe-2S)-binding protein [uncultured Sneathiella sp.]